jgi:hypothetical protein
MEFSYLRRLALDFASRERPLRETLRARPCLEMLEDRVVPYVLSGYSWANTNVTISFVPDGSQISTAQTNGTQLTNLFSTYNATATTAAWQEEFLRAWQTWADVTPLNFRVVSDNGAPYNGSGPTQGSSNYGDTRIWGMPFSDSYAEYSWYPWGGTTGGGDSSYNTKRVLHVNPASYPTIYAVALHGAGLTIGLGETTNSATVMYPTIERAYTGLSADDIAGAQAIYGARKPDAYEGSTGNNTLSTAYLLSLNSSGVFNINADLTKPCESDYFRVVAPTGGNGTLTVTLDAADHSLLIPTLTVYDASGNVLGKATAASYGSKLTINFSGLTAGHGYYIGVSPAPGAGYFGQGAYGLSAKFGGITAPSGLSPDRFDPNGTVATAASLGNLSSTTRTGLTLDSPTNVDYFTFTAATTGSYTITVKGTQSGGTGGRLGLTILNGSQTVLASSSSTSGTETLTVNLTSGARYFMKVNSRSGSLFSYSLSMTSTSSKTTSTTTNTSNGGGHHKGGNGGSLLGATGVGLVDASEPPSSMRPDTGVVQALLQTTSALAGSQHAANLPALGTIKTDQTPPTDVPPLAPIWSTDSNTIVLSTATVPAKSLDDGFWLSYVDESDGY